MAYSKLLAYSQSSDDEDDGELSSGLGSRDPLTLLSGLYSCGCEPFLQYYNNFILFFSYINNNCTRDNNLHKGFSKGLRCLGQVSAAQWPYQTSVALQTLGRLG